MRLPTGPAPRYLAPAKRQNEQDETSGSQSVFIYVSAASLSLLALVLVLYTLLKRRGLISKITPSKRGWQFWKPRGKSYGQLSTHDRSQSLSSPNSSHQAAAPNQSSARDNAAADPSVSARVDRNTSVRSVMTLPAYSMNPMDSERVIGREGERAGVDTVVEYPETGEEEEGRRDEEMESLYQIRLARRREADERDRHRQERADARELGDWARLEELRLQSRARARSSSEASNISDISAATMLVEHRSRGRESRVSSVSYADVGQVRHNGSRIRASQDSERGGLLEGVAPMGGNSGNSRPASGSSSFFSAVRTRNRSASSLSVSTATTDLDPSLSAQMAPPLHSADPRTSIGRRSPNGSDSVGHRTTESSPAADRFTPDIGSGSDDIGESSIPHTFTDEPSTAPQPPSYDAGWGEAPAYQAPVGERGILSASRSRPDQSIELDSRPTSRRTDGVPSRIPSRAPRLPHLQPLPSINVEGVSEPNTPSSPVRRHDSWART